MHVSDGRDDFDFLMGDGTLTERDFAPYGLAYRQQYWYTVGYCHLRSDLRSFRLDRVQSVVMSPAVFDRPAGFDVLAHLVQGVALLPRDYRFEVLLKTDLHAAQREINDVIGVLEPCDGGVLLRGTADDLGWVARILARLPFDFTIEQPHQLRDVVREHAHHILAQL